MNVAASAQVLSHQPCVLMFAMNLISDYLLINAELLGATVVRTPQVGRLLCFCLQVGLGTQCTPVWRDRCPAS